VIDIGCGTGLAGQALTGHGFTIIDGLDYSAEMLKVAAGHGIYRKLIEADLTKSLDLKSCKLRQRHLHRYLHSRPCRTCGLA
jgi:predicted TPR repeat methyltransferase